MAAICKVFHPVMEKGPFDNGQSEHRWRDQLPRAPAVTSLLLRQQNRRRWKPDAHMFACFPSLQEVHYEPWREVICNASPTTSQMVARASIRVEHPAASFIVDASYLFAIEPYWERLNPSSLTSTSKLLAPNENSDKIGVMLQMTAAAAMRMPQLETMEIWCGQKGLAALFKHHAFRNTQQAIITWRGTWELTPEPSTIKAWEAAVKRYGGWRLDLVQERLDNATIKSHGDAI